MKKHRRKIILSIVSLTFNCIWLLVLLFMPNSKGDISYTEAIAFVEGNEVSEIHMTQNSPEVEIVLKDDSKKMVIVPNLDEFSSFVTNEVQRGEDFEIVVSLENKAVNVLEGILNFGLWLLVAIELVSIFWLIGLLKKISKPMKTFSHFPHNTESKENSESSEISNVKFSDVAGIDEEKAQLEEVVNFLKNPQRYHASGARIPRGILLNGAPGTGKTLLAKAIAGEAGVPFFHASASSFEEKYVGVGASRVRELFSKAKKNAPCIIFIDEIDAIAQNRYNEKSHSEQTLNQLLAEMDGFESSDNIIVIAATNHIEVLDSAILRPGRFDRHVFVPMPDVLAREKILKVHAKNKYFSIDVSLAEVAKKTVGFSGADLENVLNEAAIYSVNNGDGIITNDAIEESLARVMVGLAKKNAAVTKENKYLAAVHEAGHAIVSRIVRPNVKNLGISIVPRGNAGGYNFFDEADESFYKKADLINQMQVLYGGRVAEEIVLGDISSGASNDLEKATKIAYMMVTKFGMNGGLLTTLKDKSEFSDKLTLNQIEKMENLCETAYQEAYMIIVKHKAVLLDMAELLIEKENLSQEEIEKFMTEKL